MCTQKEIYEINTHKTCGPCSAIGAANYAVGGCGSIFEVSSIEISDGFLNVGAMASDELEVIQNSTMAFTMMSELQSTRQSQAGCE
jgi:hypothetical protein